MTRLRSSLAARLIVWFVLAQSAISILALAATLLVWRQTGDEYAFAQMNLERIVIAAVRPGADGRLILSETEDLTRFRRDRPRVQVAVFRDGSALPGSSPVLTDALSHMGNPGFINAQFVFQQGPLRGATTIGTLVRGPHGPLTVVASGNRIQLADIPALALYMGGYLLPVMTLVVLGAAVVTPFVIRQAMAPLRQASIQAAAIDLRRRDLRLPVGRGVPSELLGLIVAINAALDRLDEGVSRQQRFAAETAHELRTPLAILAARLDSLAPSETVGGMRRDLERMRLLVDQLLLIARLEARQLVMDEAVDLVALARDAVADCTPLAIASGRDLALLALADGATVRGNARVLHGALRNLVENAVRAEPVGGTVKIAVGPGLAVAVIDHGRGVDEADRDRIFEPFWRREDSHPGTGLGLAIVREAAQVHGGRVIVDDTPGGGATFRLVFAQAA